MQVSDINKHNSSLIILKVNNYLKSSKTLAGRVSLFCIENDTSIMKYIFDDKYFSTQEKCVKQTSCIKSGSDGLRVYVIFCHLTIIGIIVVF